MNKLLVAGLISSLSFVFNVKDVSAELYSFNPDLNVSETEQNVTNQRPTAASNSVVIRVIEDISADVGSQQTTPLILELVQPILDSTGNIIAPENSLIKAQLVPHEKGAFILTESIITHNQEFKVTLQSDVIPGETITLSDSNTEARDNITAYSQGGVNAACGVIGLFGGNCTSKTMQTGGSLGGFVGFLAGKTAPETMQIVQIPRNKMYILSP